MPLDRGAPSLGARAAALNTRYRHHAATDVIERALGDADVGRVAMVSSFGAESVALLHLVAVVDRTTPVVFVDTEMLFAETLAYQRDVAEKLRLTDVRRVRPRALDVLEDDRAGDLHRRDPDACCALRKTRPLERALSGFDAWISGRKRYQGDTRATIDFFEPDDTGRLKINPLAHWTPADVQDYIDNNALPRHPLVARGYPSIGCAPCTTPVAAGEDPRAGRWRGTGKTECGIHFGSGGAERATEDSAAHPTEHKGDAA